MAAVGGCWHREAIRVKAQKKSVISLSSRPASAAIRLYHPAKLDSSSGMIAGKYRFNGG